MASIKRNVTEAPGVMSNLPKRSERTPCDWAVSEFVTHLEKHTPAAPLSVRTLEAFRSFRSFSADGQLRHLPKLYLDWEGDHSGAEIRHAMRLEVTKLLQREFEPLLARPKFGLIFLRDRPQEFYLCRMVLVRMLRDVTRFTEQIDGEQITSLISWLETAPNADAPVPLKLHKKIPKYHSEWTGLLMRMSEKIVHELTDHLGEDLTQSFYERAFDSAYQTYSTLDTFAIAGYLLPNNLLDAKKLKPIKRSEMRETYLRCIESSNHHTTRLSDQNDELMTARFELEDSKSALEDRVATRTAELLTAKEAAEMAARAKGEFLATMSHELRTPLNAILGFSEMISKAALGPVDQRYRDYGLHIHDSGQHLLSLVNDVLDLSKLESGKFEIHGEHIYIAEILDACKSMVVGLAKEASVSLSVDTQKDLSPVMADPLRIKQIVVNLLSNAIKFTQEGGKVKLSAIMDAGGDIVIKVEDSGIGMDRAGIDKALEPFGQVNSTMNRSHGGTGLGLPVVKHLAELHGGELSIASELGSGTCVTVRLPCHEAQMSADPQATVAAAS